MTSKHTQSTFKFQAKTSLVAMGAICAFGLTQNAQAIVAESNYAPSSSEATVQNSASYFVPMRTLRVTADDTSIKSGSAGLLSSQITRAKADRVDGSVVLVQGQLPLAFGDVNLGARNIQEIAETGQLKAFSDKASKAIANAVVKTLKSSELFELSAWPTEAPHWLLTQNALTSTQNSLLFPSNSLWLDVRFRVQK